MQFKSFMEALKGKQHKLDKNKNGELDAHDFKLLRKEESELSEEERMARADYKVGPSGRKSHKEITFKDGSDDKKDDELKREHVEVEETVNEEMSDAQMKKRETYVKGMKKNIAGFKAKYGARAKDVMYATATKMAMKEESEQIEESMADSWKKVQSMDKGSVTGGREEAKKRLAYLNAVHDHHKKFGNDTKKVKSEIESINRSRIAEDVELEEGYVVRYNNPKSEKHGSEKHFTVQAAAQKHADRGNSVDKIGGKYTVHKTNEKGHDMKEEVELDEAVESGNKGNGYHGQHDSEVADKKYSAMHAKVKKIAGEAGHLRDAKKPNVMVKHYLDSRHGRHLAGNENDHEYIKKDFGRFKKAYKPEMHEGVDFDEEGNLMAEKLTFSDFLAKINEQLLEYESKDGRYVHTKGSYGKSYQPDDDDDEDAPKKPAQPAVKRGRGRPAGSKSGANQKVTSGKSYGGIATHSLHLPNTK